MILLNLFEEPVRNKKNWFSQSILMVAGSTFRCILTLLSRNRIWCRKAQNFLRRRGASVFRSPTAPIFYLRPMPTNPAHFYIQTANGPNNMPKKSKNLVFPTKCAYLYAVHFFLRNFILFLSYYIRFWLFANQKGAEYAELGLR